MDLIGVGEKWTLTNELIVDICNVTFLLVLFRLVLLKIMNV